MEPDYPQIRMMQRYKEYLSNMFKREVSELETAILWDEHNARVYRQRHKYLDLLKKDDKNEREKS